MSPPTRAGRELAGIGVEVALAFLAGLGFAAVPVARSLHEVSGRS